MNKLCIVASIFLWGTFASAETLFFDDFENGLDNWTGKNHTVPTAKVVDDPVNDGHGKVVTFTEKVIEGDIYTKVIISNLPINKPYILEFDYLGIPVRKSREGNGGYIGYSRNTNPGGGPSNHRWIGGTKNSYSIYRGDQYQFLKDDGKWNHYKVDLSATDFPDFVLMLEDYLYARGIAGDAYFDNILLTDARGPSDFKLTVITKGNGQVNSVPDGIDCGTNCEESYTDGTDITLIVTPDAGSTFSNWQGDCSGDNNIIVTIDASKTCTAIFEKQFQLTVDKKGNGKIHSTTPGINCGTDCNEIYNGGSTVTLIATPDANSTFSGWQGACDGDKPVNKPVNKTVMGKFKNFFGFGEGDNNSNSSNSSNDTNYATTMIMDANKTCTAKFTTQIPLTVNKSGKGNGSITSNIPGINCGTDCNENYTENKQVTLIANPDSNSMFIGWSNDCSGNNPSINIIMDTAKTCTAIFKSKFPLTVNKTGNGNGLVISNQINCGTNCTNNYTDGTEIVLTATPDENSIFIDWQDACNGTDNSTTVIIDKAKTCTVVFDKIERCEELPKAEVGMVFSAKFPDKPGKYYIVPAEVAESCLKIVESSTVLIIEKVPECQPKKSGTKLNTQIK